MNIFHFDINRTIQLAAGFLSRAPGKSMYYVKLLKLMYLADRESIVKTSYPITGDALFAMERGPVLSDVLYLMSGEKQSDEWDKYFDSSEKDRIKLRQSPGDGLMSEFDDETMDMLYERFKDHSVKEIVQYTHDLPEWKRKEASVPADIDVRDILIDANYSEKEITGALALIEEATDMLRGEAMACGEGA